MKKLLILMLCALAALSLAACGASAEEPAPTPDPAALEPLTPVVPAEELEEASAADARALAEEEPPASDTDADAETEEPAALDAEALAAAEDCVGRSVEELYAAVGEPDRTSYAASCLEENAEDGMLFYETLGFYVWTVRNADGETVHAAYPLD